MPDPKTPLSLLFLSASVKRRTFEPVLIHSVSVDAEAWIQFLSIGFIPAFAMLMCTFVVRVCH